MLKRKPRAQEHINTERWLVSYADLLQLLFIIFVVLFALKNVSPEDVRDFAAGVRNQYRIRPQIGLSADTVGRAVPLPLDFAYQEQRRMEAAEEELSAYLRRHGLDDQVEVELTRAGLTLRLQGVILFDENSAVIRRDAHGTLRKIGEVLRHFPDNPIHVEGHVDTIPFLPGSPYQSSWQLGADRAVAVAEFLLDLGAVRDEQLVVISYGETRPVAPSDTPENRARNRRVEITIQRLAPEPKAADAPDASITEPIVPIPGIEPPARTLEAAEGRAQRGD